MAVGKTAKGGDTGELTVEVEAQARKRADPRWLPVEPRHLLPSRILAKDYGLTMHASKACGSVKGCLHSWTYLHNETVNIFSHVVGALVFFGLPLYVFAAGAAPRYAIAEPTDIVACTVYLLGVAACFVLSAIFHTFMSHSERAYRLGMRLDVHGILVLMWSATVPLLRYNFACRPGLGAAYLGLTSALALLCSAATSWPRFSGPRLGHVRAALLGAFGAGSFVAPIAHGMLLDGVAAQSERIAAPWILLTVLFNGAGVAAYTLKFPERWFPRRFDLFGASHQIMHVMVVLAALAFSAAVLQAFDFSHGQGAVC